MDGTNLIPSSIQRIRQFLVESCGMKVKPWAGVDETLQALHAVLVAKQGCALFWPLLRELLTTLTHDLGQREQGNVLDNEILQPDRYATLLDEIRAAAASATAGPGVFARVSATLSLPAAALLCLLAGVTTVGCAANPLPLQDTTKDAGTTIDSPSSKDAVTPDLRIPWEAPPPVDYRPQYPAPDCGEAGSCTVEDVMRACGFGPSTAVAQVINCLDRLNDSWRANMPSALTRSGDCLNTGQLLYCFVNGNGVYNETCRNIPADAGFSEYEMCRPMPIYLGVRFV